MPYLRGLGSNLHTVAFACCLTALSGVLFALIPIARISLSQSMEGLREGTRGGSGLTWRRYGTSLVVVEVALAMVLMTGAALLGKSLNALLHVQTGMKLDGLASVDLKWAMARYSSDGEKVALGHEIVAKIAALPGVSSVAISLASPLGAAWGNASFHISGRPNRGENNQVLNRQVSAGYFSTLQARLMRGRYFRETENASQPRVAIVNRSLANRYVAGEEPIGKQIYYDWAPNSPMEIVGVVDDIKEGPLESANLPVLTRHSRNETGLGSPKFFKSASNPHGYRAQKHPTKIFCQQKAEFHHKGTIRSFRPESEGLVRRPDSNHAVRAIGACFHRCRDPPDRS